MVPQWPRHVAQTCCVLIFVTITRQIVSLNICSQYRKHFPRQKDSYLRSVKVSAHGVFNSKPKDLTMGLHVAVLRATETTEGQKEQTSLTKQ